MIPSPAALSIPDHELIRRIGEGSYGEVWLARNTVGTARAVKIIYRDKFDSARPFEREFAGLQRYEPLSRSHEGLMDVLHLGRNEAAGYFFYVMELADAVPTADRPADTVVPDSEYRSLTLRQMIDSQGRLPPEACVRYFLSLTSGLGQLHRFGLIHRDVKPSNIIFAGGIAKLADIGLVAELSGSRSFVGTDGFIPPEGPGTAEADLFSLGRTLYEAFTGLDRAEFPRLPIKECGGLAMIAPLLEINAVALRACSPSAGDRYQSADEMHGELALIQSGRSVQHLRSLEVRLKMVRRLAAGLAAAAFGLLTLFGAWSWMTRREAVMLRERTAVETRLRNESEATLYDRLMTTAHHAGRSIDAGSAEAALAAILRAKDLRGNSAVLRSEALVALSRLELIPEPALEALPQAGLPPGAGGGGFSPDGTLLAHFREDAGTMGQGGVVVMNVITGEELGRFPFPSDGPMEAGQAGPISADNRLLLTMNAGGWTVWDLTSRSMVRAMINHPGETAFLPGGTFSSNGEDVLRLRSDNTLIQWSVATGERREWPIASEPVARWLVAPQGKTVVYSVKSGPQAASSLSLDLATGRKSSFPIGSPMTAAAWDVTGRFLIGATRDQVVEIADFRRPEGFFGVPRVLASWDHMPSSPSVALSPHGERMAMQTIDGMLHVWDVLYKREIARTAMQVGSLHLSRTHLCAYLPGAARWRAWRLVEPRVLQPLRRDTASGAHFTHQAQRPPMGTAGNVICGYSGNDWCVWEGNSLRLLGTIPETNEESYSFQETPAGGLEFSSSDQHGRFSRTWKVEHGVLRIGPVNRQPPPPPAEVASPIRVVKSGNLLRAYDAIKPHPIWECPLPASWIDHTSAQLWPTAAPSLLLIQTGPGTLSLISAATGLLLLNLEVPGGEALANFGFLGDQPEIQTMLQTGHLYIWNLKHIRKELAALGLDWPGADLPPGGPPVPIRKMIVEDR